MLRSLWLWITIALIAAGVAMTAALGVLTWLIALLGALVLLNVGLFLYAAYGVGDTEPPSLPPLDAVPGERRIPLIYDCDLTMGRPFRSVGDGLALLYLLGEPRIDLRAVTTTYGNGPIGMTTRTTRQLLNDLNLDHVVVAQGARGPDDDPAENKAAQLLAEAIDDSPDEVIVLATGALTNLKHAAMLNPDVFRKLRSLYLVGGVTSVTGTLSWNERQLAERNFSADPEAAYVAIQPDCPTTIAPAEAALTAMFRSSTFASLQALEGPALRMIARKIRLWFGLMRLWFRDDGFPMWESVAALAIAHPELFDFKRVHLPVTIEDLHTGRLAVDTSRSGPVRLIEGLQDPDRFMKVNMAAWQRLNYLMAEQGEILGAPHLDASDVGERAEP